MKSSGLKIKKGLIIKFIISFVLMSYLFWKVDLKEIKALLSNVNLRLFIFSIFVITADRIWMAYKWNILLKAKGLRTSILKVIKSYYEGTFFGFFLPISVGGEGVRLYSISKDLKDVKGILASMFIEKFIGFIGVSIFCCFSLIILAERSKELSTFTSSFILIFSLFVIIFILSLWGNFFEIINRTLGSINIPFRKKIEDFYNSYIEYRNLKKSLFIFFILTLFEQLFPISVNYFISLSLNLEIPLINFFIFIPIIYLTARIPISVDAIGIQEGLYVLFFNMAGISSDDALMLGIIGRIATYLSVIPGGAFYLIDRKSLKGRY